MSEFIDPYAPVGESASPDATPETGETSTRHETGVPKGTVKEVLAWVATDKERAAAALEAEEKDETPRKGLIHELKERI